MRESTVQLRELLRRGSGSGVYAVEWVGSLLYDGTPKARNLKLLEPSFSWDWASKIQGKGSCQILWADVWGASIVPRQIGDLFSPYGAELQVDVQIRAGKFVERIPMGRFVLDETPAGVEYAIPNPHGGEPIVAESRITLTLSDYFLRIARDTFPFPSSPKTTSMWEEAQRLTGLPVVRSVPDRPIPTAISYEEDRLEALEKVFGPSNAIPALTSTGALTARSKEWSEPVDTLRAVVASPLKMRSENVYNRVVVEGKNPDADGTPLVAVAEITDGFLRVRNKDGTRSPYGGNTYRYSNQSLHTQAQCQATAEDLLSQVSRIRSVTREITEAFNPLREIGDVLTFVDPTRIGETSLVRVTAVRHQGAETRLTVEVPDA